MRTTAKDYARQVIALDDTALEEFVRQWVSRRCQYLEVHRFTGTGDMGRDVVGFVTASRHEGDWDNYQCKQYGRTLPTETGILEVGKVLHYSHQGHFTRPREFFFVAPRGVNRNLKDLIFNPAKFKQTLVEKWDQYCAQKISEGISIALDSSLRDWIEEWDFSKIRPLSVEMILEDPAALSVLAAWFGADPGPAPSGIVPTEVEARELPYLEQLIDAYSEREGNQFANHAAVLRHEEHGSHFWMQRERFYDADSFVRFYRESIDAQEIDTFKRDIHHGIIDVHRSAHADTLARVDAVMGQAARLQPCGILEKYARVPVKQGVCHHFVNEGILRWRKN
ncbi:MAG: hypothetical protein JWQ49_3328 [Edaphobacter sp.]|nr:hypothetical protein [Edaphobacter sp.]